MAGCPTELIAGSSYRPAKSPSHLARYLLFSPAALPAAARFFL